MLSSSASKEARTDQKFVVVMIVNPAGGDDVNVMAANAKKVQRAQIPMVAPGTGGKFQQGIEGGVVQVSFVGEYISLPNLYEGLARFQY